MKSVTFKRALFAVFAAASAFAGAQTIDPYFSGNYSYTDIGSAPGVPTNYGGLCLLAGSSTHLLLGGAANGTSGQIFDVGVTRNAGGHINGFTGVTTLFANAPYNDGGITYGPGGLLYAAQWPVNMLAMYKPGSTNPDRVIDLAPLGVAGSLSALNFVPATLPGAGKMKLVSYSGGQFYNANYTIDGSGLLAISSVTQTATVPGAPEGFTYVPTGSPLITNPSMILSEYGAGNVVIYDLDANGDPVIASRKLFMSGLSGVEGAFIDPTTGDFLFSTFGSGNRVIVVSGFAAVPEPATLLTLGGLAALAIRRRKGK